MKTMRITKKMFNSAEDLLAAAGAIKGNRAFPYFVYMNPKEYKKFTSNIKKAFKKKYKFLSKHKIDSSTSMYLLNLGPTTVEGVREGFIIIDNRQIEAAISNQGEYDGN